MLTSLLRKFRDHAPEATGPTDKWYNWNVMIQGKHPSGDGWANHYVVRAQDLRQAVLKVERQVLRGSPKGTSIVAIGMTGVAYGGQVIK